MSVRQRILTLKLLEKQKKNPELMKKLKIEVKVSDAKKILYKGDYQNEEKD